MNKSFAEYCQKIERVDTPFVCDASTGNFIWLPRLMERYPHALFVYIDRDPKEVAASVCDIMDDDEAIDMDALIRARAYCLDTIKHAHRYMLVEFDAIDANLEPMHNLMMPGVPFDKDRAEFFRRVNIQLTGEAFEECLQAKVPKEMEEEIHAIFG